MTKKINLNYLKNLVDKTINNFKKIKISKGIKRAFVIILFSSLLLFIFVNRDSFSPDNIMDSIQDSFNSLGVGHNFPYEVTEKKITNQNFKTIGRNIVFVSDIETVCLNDTAKEISKRQHSYSNPILKTNGNKILVYDAYNKGFDVGTISKCVLKKNLNDDILAGDISRNGTYAFITKSKTSLGKLEVFKNKESDPFFEYFFQNFYITDLAFNPNGKLCACVGVDADSSEIKSSVFVFDYKNQTPKKIDFDNTMILNIKYINEKNIVVIGDNIISIVDTNNGTRKDYDFKNKILTSFCINDNKIIISLSLSDDGDNCEMLIFDKSGNLENTIKTDLKITSLSYKSNKIAALSYSKIYIYNKKGKIIKSFECEKSTKKIEFLSANTVYTLTLADVKKLSF